MTPDEFWARVDRSGGPEACWPWTGCRDANGYGWLRWGGKRARAHVVALLLDGRPVEPGMVGRHLCLGGLKHCCNPKHLAPGSHWDNAQDRVRAGTSANKRKLSPERTAELRRYYLKGLATSTELARLFGVDASHVRHVGKGHLPEGGRNGRAGSGVEVDAVGAALAAATGAGVPGGWAGAAGGGLVGG